MSADWSWDRTPGSTPGSTRRSAQGPAPKHSPPDRANTARPAPGGEHLKFGRRMFRAHISGDDYPSCEGNSVVARGAAAQRTIRGGTPACGAERPWGRAGGPHPLELRADSTLSPRPRRENDGTRFPGDRLAPASAVLPRRRRRARTRCRGCGCTRPRTTWGWPSTWRRSPSSAARSTWCRACWPSSKPT